MVSVIIPMYNAKNYICEALSSVLIQHVDMEVLILDDASTDGSADCVKHWIAAHPRMVKDTPVKVLSFAKNRGVAAMRKEGVMLAKGEYIAFLDADDFWEEGKLQKQLACMEATHACLCNTGRRLIKADGTQTDIVMHTPRKITLQKLEHSNYITCSSVLVRRDVMLQYPMKHSFLHEDYLTWLAMLHDYAYAVGIDEPLVRYRLSENGRSRNKCKAAWMTWLTYCYAGYSWLAACRMMLGYMVNGIRKYRGQGRKH